MKYFDIAMYGLGVMGSSLAKNMIHHGINVAVYSKDEAERKRFAVPGMENIYLVCSDTKELLQSLKRSRIIFLMITAGNAVDLVIKELLPDLQEGDVLIDGGNSWFSDTMRRYTFLKEKGIHYLGIGISGGERGALTGPSMMVGGSKNGWERSKNILQKISAHYAGMPCCVYLGNEGAGHYVKMIHNGIEYGIMQLISETYDYLRNGMGVEHKEILELFRSWKSGRLASYLMDISVVVLEKMDEDGTPLIEKIKDVAGQKGTGFWSARESLEMGVYAPVIFEAVQARSFSGREKERILGQKSIPEGRCAGLFENLDDEVKRIFEESLYWGIVCCYSQGLEIIRAANEKYQWKISLEEVVRVWKNGCIIRSEMLNDIETAVKEHSDQPLICSHLWMDKEEAIRSIRLLAANGILSSIPCAAFLAAANYCEYYSSSYMPVSFLQGLRDCFGAHTYQRIDKEGSFHTDWE